MLFASTGRLQYSISDIPNFLRARTLAAKADAAIDQAKFKQVIASHGLGGSATATNISTSSPGCARK